LVEKSKKIVAERLGTTKNQESVGEGVFRPGSPLRKPRGFTTAQSAPFSTFSTVWLVFVPASVIIGLYLGLANGSVVVLHFQLPFPCPK